MLRPSAMCSCACAFINNPRTSRQITMICRPSTWIVRTSKPRTTICNRALSLGSNKPRGSGCSAASSNADAQEIARTSSAPQARGFDVLRAVTAATSLSALSVALSLDLLMPHTALANELGKQVFNNNCAACHQGGRNSVLPDKTLDKEALEKYLSGGFKLESIIYQVQNGKGGMPAWENVLDEDEIEAVAKYVYDTATAGTWASQ